MKSLGFTQWLLIITGFLPPLLQLWPLEPDWVAWRPLYPVVFIGFWTYVQPNVIGGVAGFFYGLLIELMAGVPTGLYAIPCGFLSVAISAHYLKFRAFTPVQQGALVFACCLVTFSVSYAIAYWSLGVNFWWMAWLSALTTSMVWLICRRFFANAVFRTIKHHV